MKKLFKALAVMALGTTMVCGFAACKDDGGNSLDSEGNTIVKIMFHVDERSTEGQAYKKRIEAFNTAYKDKKIKASATYKARTAGAAGYETELTNQQTAGTLADIVTYDAPNCASYAKSKLLYDISDLVPVETQNAFYDFSLNKYDGKLYGLPIQESSAGFYYNKKLFAQAGIDVSGYTVDNPWTFAQFKEVCAKLKTANITPVDMRLDATKDETATYLLYPFIYAAGGEFTSTDGLTANGIFNSDGTKKGFQFLKDLVSADYTSFKIGATDFFDGKVGMYLSSGWTIPELKSGKYDKVTEWGLLPYPQDTAKASATGSWSFGITNNKNKDKSAAKELLLWMTSEESSKDITTATGMIPARKGVKSYDAGSPEDVLLKQLEKTGRARPSTIAYPQFSTGFASVISALNGNDWQSVLNSKTSELQAQMDMLKNR